MTDVVKMLYYAVLKLIILIQTTENTESAVTVHISFIQSSATASFYSYPKHMQSRQ